MLQSDFNIDITYPVAKTIQKDISAGLRITLSGPGTDTNINPIARQTTAKDERQTDELRKPNTSLCLHALSGSEGLCLNIRYLIRLSIRFEAIGELEDGASTERLSSRGDFFQFQRSLQRTFYLFTGLLSLQYHEGARIFRALLNSGLSGCLQN